MPRRLLLAAEILRDVAREVNAADRPLLRAAADELADRAEELLAGDACRDPIPRLPATLPARIGSDGGSRLDQALSVH